MQGKTLTWAGVLTNTGQNHANRNTLHSNIWAQKKKTCISVQTMREYPIVMNRVQRVEFYLIFTGRETLARLLSYKTLAFTKPAHKP